MSNAEDNVSQGKIYNEYINHIHIHLALNIDISTNLHAYISMAYLFIIGVYTWIYIYIEVYGIHKLMDKNLIYDLNIYMNK